MGATAIGTGITAHPDYAARVIAHLRAITGIPLATAPNLIEATQDCGAFVQLSGVLKRGVLLSKKSCHDLRLRLQRPARGPGRDQPAGGAGGPVHHAGKINPEIPEVVNQIAYEVIGNDVTVTLPPRRQLQPQRVEPIIAHSLFRSKHLSAGCRTLADRLRAAASAPTCSN